MDERLVSRDLFAAYLRTLPHSEVVEAVRVTGDHYEAGPATQVQPGVRVLPVTDRRTTTLNRVLSTFRPSIVHFPFEMPAKLAFPSVFTLHDPGDTSTPS